MDGYKNIYLHSGREGRHTVCEHVIELHSELGWLKCGRLNVCLLLICSKEAFGFGLDLRENLNLKHAHLSLERDMGPAFTTNLERFRGHTVDLVFFPKEPAGIPVPKRASGVQPCNSVSWKPPAKQLYLQHHTVYSAIHL